MNKSYKKIMSKSFSLIALAIAVVGLGFGYTQLTTLQVAEASPSDNVFGYAWNDNTGWISLNCADESTCGSSDYGVNIEETTSGATHDFSGYGWSSNLGWVNFGSNNCSATGAYLNASDVEAYTTGVTTTIPVNGMIEVISAQNASIEQNGGWSGCVSMRNDSVGYGVDMTYNSSTNEFDFGGRAWNANSQTSGGDSIGMGWIHFDNAFSTINFLSDANCVLVGQFLAQSCSEEATFSWECTQVVEDSCTLYLAENGASPVAVASGLPATNQGMATATEYPISDSNVDYSFYIGCDDLFGGATVESQVESTVFTTTCLPDPQCSDGVDNDGDGTIDNGPGVSNPDISCYQPTCDIETGTYNSEWDDESLSTEECIVITLWCDLPENQNSCTCNPGQPECTPLPCVPGAPECPITGPGALAVPDIIES